MKKTKWFIIIFCVVIVILLIVCLFGIFNNKKELVCRNKYEQTEYTIDSEYIIKAKRDKVTNAEVNILIRSENEEKLNNLKDKYTEQFEHDKTTYGGYTFNIDTKTGSLSIKVNIDYSKLNFNKYLEDNVSLKSYMENKYTIDNAKKLYESNGATCKYN